MTSTVSKQFYKSGQLKRITYLTNHSPHREDGPAVQAFLRDGSLESESYFINGELTKLIKYTNNIAHTIKRFKNGKLHGSPSVELFDHYGRKTYEAHHKNELLHREDGPAIEAWQEAIDSQMFITSREFFINGKRHNLHGPARQRHFSFSLTDDEDYFIDNTWVPSFQRILDAENKLTEIFNYLTNHKKHAWVIETLINKEILPYPKTVIENIKLVYAL